jgi:4-amino-4-deoxy-L-arabinose transferase-like glycosyltransferase
MGEPPLGATQPSSRWRLFLWHHPYARVLLLALALRAVWALLIPVVPISDSHAYDVFARNLASGLGYCWAPGRVTAYWPVGTPFVYSVFYVLFGHSYAPIVVFHVVLGLLTILCSMLLAERWFSRRVAIAAGLILALWPSQIEFTTVLASEPLFIALIVGSLWVWTTPRIGFWTRALLVGALLAFATYVRPTAALLPILFAMTALPRERRRARPIAAAVVASLVIAALLVPWAVRNERAFGSLVPTTTSGGANLWMGNNPESVGGYMPYPERLGETMNEAQIDQHLGAIAKGYIRQYPGRFVIRTLVKLVRLHESETIGVAWNAEGLTQRFGRKVFIPLKIISTGYWLVALALGVIGIAFLVIARGIVALVEPAVLIWGYFAVLHAVIVIGDRYHFSSIPFIAILAAFALVSLRERAKRETVSAG